MAWPTLSGAHRWVLLLLILLVNSQGQKAPVITRQEKLQGIIRVKFLEATEKLPPIPTLKADSALKIIGVNPEWVLVDVRAPAEQNVSMILDAYTPESFAKQFSKGIPKNLHVLAYCTIGYRSGIYAQQLRNLGLDAYNLEGGILAWLSVGGAVFHHDSLGNRLVTQNVHVWSKDYALVPPGFNAIY